MMLLVFLKAFLSASWWGDGLKKAWSWLKQVPAWVWTVLAFGLAYLAWQSSRRWKNKAAAQQRFVQAQVKLANRLYDIKVKHAQEIEQIEQKHTVEVKKIEEQQDKIESSSTASEVADLLNESFNKSDGSE